MGAVFFKQVAFEGEADFISVRIGSNAQFTGAKFEKRANFNSAHIERESHFERTIFTNDISFQNAFLKTIYFGESEFQFHTKIDLIGCIYDRIDPAPFWKQLMEHFSPYDWQPFTQLEETFRRAGNDKFANDVYYKRKRRESAQKTIENPGTWLIDRVLWLSTGYGVRLYRTPPQLELFQTSETLM